MSNATSVARESHEISDRRAGRAALNWALAGLSLSMLMPSLDTSIANAALPTLAAAFGASFPQVQWIVLMYLLAITTLIVGAGRLGDTFGRRRLLLAGILLFTFASLLCGLATTLWMLVVARAVQGAGAAVMMALALATVSDTVPKARVGRAMGLLGTMSAVGTTLGPSLGGLLIEGFGWHAIFFVNVPVGLLTFALAFSHLPAEADRPTTARPAFDTRGTVVLALTLAVYALAMTRGQGQLGAQNAALLASAAAGASLFVFLQARTASPLVHVAMLRHAALGSRLAMSALVSAVMMSTLVVGPFYLARALGLTGVSVGMALSAGPLVSALTGVPAGRLVDRFGSLRVTTAGLVGLACGALPLSLMPATAGVPGYLAFLVVMTASYAVFQAANNTAIMGTVGEHDRGVVAGLLSLSRNLGLITGASFMGAVFAFGTASADVMTARPDAIASGTRFTFGVATALITVALALSARQHFSTRLTHH